jgi:hypothetical protein
MEVAMNNINWYIKAFYFAAGIAVSMTTVMLLSVILALFAPDFLK